MNKKATWMQELQFPSLTPKQLSSRALLVEEMDRMCDKAVQNGASTAVYQFVNGRRYANQLLDWSPEEDAPAQNTSAAQKAAYERKIEKQENLMETVSNHGKFQMRRSITTSWLRRARTALMVERSCSQKLAS